MEIRVETHSGYRADEYPVSFHLNGRTLEVIDIEDRWYGPDSSYFKIFASNAKRYILRRYLKTGLWEITVL